MNKPTPRQTFALFCISKTDVRNCPSLTFELASQIISLSKIDFAKAVEMVKSLPGAVVKGEAKPKQDWGAVYNEAKAAGIAAGNASVPVPMVVCEHINPLDDNSPIKRVYEPILDGCCGFSSVVISDGRSSFATWARNSKLGYKDYYGGWAIPVHEHNQSLTKKDAHASAMAEVFSKYGIKCRVSSRMD